MTKKRALKYKRSDEIFLLFFVWSPLRPFSLLNQGCTLSMSYQYDRDDRKKLHCMCYRRVEHTVFIYSSTSGHYMCYDLKRKRKKEDTMWP